MEIKTMSFHGCAPCYDRIKVGNKMDNLASRVRFVLHPELDDATVFLYLSNENHSDIIQLEGDRVYTPTRNQTQYPGRWTAFLEAHVGDDVVWHSDTFILYVGDLPDIGDLVEQAYPTAVEKALDAVDMLTGVQARAITLDPGSDATVSLDEDASGNRIIVYGIPAGVRGLPGLDAPQIDDTQASAKHPWSGAKVNDEISQLRDDIAGKITAPSTATVGQTVVVKAVDEAGKPIEWSAESVMNEVDALEALVECGVLNPVYQDGVFYTDADGAIYTL